MADHCLDQLFQRVGCDEELLHEIKVNGRFDKLRAKCAGQNNNELLNLIDLVHYLWHSSGDVENLFKGFMEKFPENNHSKIFSLCVYPPLDNRLEQVKELLRIYRIIFFSLMPRMLKNFRNLPWEHLLVSVPSYKTEENWKVAFGLATFVCITFTTHVNLQYFLLKVFITLKFPETRDFLLEHFKLEKKK